jgi:uncharacterized membrane protein YgcG
MVLLTSQVMPSQPEVQGSVPGTQLLRIPALSTNADLIVCSKAGATGGEGGDGGGYTGGGGGEGGGGGDGGVGQEDPTEVLV